MKKLFLALLLLTSPVYAYGTNGCDNKTVLLMHFDNGSLTDNECNGPPKVITNQGSTADATKYKFGNGSRAFNGIGNYFTLASSPDFAMGTGDFTVDFWVNFAASGVQDWFQNQDTTNELDIEYDGATGIKVFLHGTLYTFAWSPSTNIWYHVEVGRNGTNLRAFIDGTQIGTTQTSSDNIVNAGTLFIATDNATLGFINGNLDEYRITKGVCRHTANFTRPQTPYCAGCEVAGELNE